IHQSDLASRNPYNTYQHTGLPPGPIANPGADAIRAALHPAQTDYLYFVAKPEGGGHKFSTTLAQHEKATAQYRKKARKRSS
ncbi:MAG: endolytic transglycosylase MltG, partial [Bryobacteraceae bacterium]